MSKTDDAADARINLEDVPEGNRTATLHNRSWQRIIEMLVRETEETGNPTPAAIAGTIQAQGIIFEDE